MAKVSANSTVNTSFTNYDAKKSMLSREERKCQTGLRYPSRSALANSGMSKIWGKMVKNTSQIKQYTSTSSITKSRLDLQHQALDSIINSMQDFKQLVIMGMNSPTPLDLATHAKTALERLQMQLNSPDASGTPIFASLQQNTPPVGSGTVTDISTQSIWDLLPQGIGFPASGSSAGPSFVYDTATMLTTKYTSDSTYSSSVQLSGSVSIEQNISIREDAIRYTIGALQIFAFSGNPTPKIGREQGFQLLEKAIKELTTLKETVENRGSYVEFATTEIEDMKLAVAKISEQFEWDSADSLFIIPPLNRNLEEMLTLIKMELNQRTLASML